MKIIDSHLHLFPETEAWAEEKARLVGHENSIEHLRSAYEAAGIVHHAQRLEHSSACRETGSIVLSGSRRATAEGALVICEHTRDQAGPTRQGPLHACDLEHAHAHSSRCHGYSTVTDLARLRGLSTS